MRRSHLAIVLSLPALFAAAWVAWLAWGLDSHEGVASRLDRSE